MRECAIKQVGNHSLNIASLYHNSYNFNALLRISLNAHLSRGCFLRDYKNINHKTKLQLSEFLKMKLLKIAAKEIYANQEQNAALRSLHLDSGSVEIHLTKSANINIQRYEPNTIHSHHTTRTHQTGPAIMGLITSNNSTQNSISFSK
ncbi:hypothetical protein PoB_002784100 [Plakobranchus ocellatus]|uniref:Uncharacterized protein n=1 Tax=Plakobranchus ocellatus TaxID=259542 RepID=A0AAV4A3R3_9GAST|nr:hypothetical protein PoB_002784100 [Plakobranchus ocellatus]